jgi:hypothetical protein
MCARHAMATAAGLPHICFVLAKKIMGNASSAPGVALAPSRPPR